MSSFLLSTEQLSVEIRAPGSGYRGSRFDWTTQVVQVRLGDHTFLTREKSDDASENQGRGLAGEFGIDTPIGYDETPVGGVFPKIGVGGLVKPDTAPYAFHREYETLPAEFRTTSELSSLEITATSRQAKWSWALARRWSVSGTSLTLETSLTNTGGHELRTEEYIHNFLSFDEGRVSPEWTLSIPGSWSPQARQSAVDPEGLLVFHEGKLTWKKAPNREFFVIDTPGPRTWLLNHDSGASIQEEVGFEASSLHVWGHGSVVSPELFHEIAVPVGSTQEWKRMWTFHRPGETK